MATEATALVVEDDEALQRSLLMTLKAAGYRAFGAASLAEAQKGFTHHRPDVVLIDLGLPDGEGLDFVTRVRGDGMLTPIVVLTARDSEALKVAALDTGADDYVVKPFGVDELLARLRAALRHGVQARGATPIVRTGGIEIDLAGRIVRREGREIALSPKEFEILAMLAMSLGGVVRRQDILAAVWGSERADIQYLRVYVGQLRAKLEAEPGNPRLLVSDPGVGYRLIAAPSA